MMTSLKVVLQFAIVSIAIAETAPERRELMAGGTPSAGAGAGASPGAPGASIPAHDGHSSGPAEKQHATSDEKSEHSPWNQEVITTLVTVGSVLFLVFCLCLTGATYWVSKKKDFPEEKAQKDAEAPQVIGDTEEKKFGHVHSDASTAASDIELQQVEQ